jgi:carboxylesterase type B
MCSTVPNLFNRAILQSGVACSLTPLSLNEYDQSYQKLLRLLDIPLEEPLEERLKKLRSVPWEMFIDSYEHLDNAYPAFPGVEGWFWREPMDAKNGNELLAKCEWVGEVIIGDCLVEVRPPFHCQSNGRAKSSK